MLPSDELYGTAFEFHYSQNSLVERNSLLQRFPLPKDAIFMQNARVHKRLIYKIPRRMSMQDIKNYIFKCLYESNDAFSSVEVINENDHYEVAVSL